MVSITVIAAQKLKSLIAQENIDIILPDTAGLRLLITAKNRLGSLQIEPAPKNSDFIISSNDIRIFVDPESQEYIKNSNRKELLIYWIGTKDNEGFAIENPETRSYYRTKEKENR